MYIYIYIYIYVQEAWFVEFTIMVRIVVVFMCKLALVCLTGIGIVLLCSQAPRV